MILSEFVYPYLSCCHGNGFNCFSWRRHVWDPICEWVMACTWLHTQVVLQEEEGQNIIIIAAYLWFSNKCIQKVWWKRYSYNQQQKHLSPLDLTMEWHSLIGSYTTIIWFKIYLIKNQLCWSGRIHIESLQIRRWVL